MIRLKQKGDTIIEVLLAIAVISTILSGAYVSSRRNLVATQQARERDQAVRLLETQIERLKAAGAASSIFTGGADFCLDGALVKVTPNCRLDSANNTHDPATSQSIPYDISVHRSGVGSNLIFNAQANWDKANAAGREQANLVYRTYQ